MTEAPPPKSTVSVIKKKPSRALRPFLICLATGAAIGALIGDVKLWTVIGINVGAFLGLYLDRSIMKPKELWGCGAALVFGFLVFMLTL